MMRMCRLRCVTWSLVCLVSLSRAAHAQTAESVDELRSWWGGHAGFVMYGTGYERDCSTGGGLSLGGEIRTRGVWFGAAGVDVFLASRFYCTASGELTTFRGETVGVSRGTELLASPRLRIRAGRAFGLGDASLEPSVAIGGIYSRTDVIAGAGGWKLNGWAGVSLTVRGGGMPFGVELEYGRHQVPIRYYDLSTHAVVHEFRRWKPLWRLSLVR